MKPPILSAVCNSYNPIINDIYLQMGDLRYIPLTNGFLELNPRDQLIVIKACIRTHSNLLKFNVPGYGRILYYELYIQTKEFTSLTIFNIKGKLLSSREIKSFNERN